MWYYRGVSFCNPLHWLRVDGLIICLSSSIIQALTLRICISTKLGMLGCSHFLTKSQSSAQRLIQNVWNVCYTCRLRCVIMNLSATHYFTRGSYDTTTHHVKNRKMHIICTRKMLCTYIWNCLIYPLRDDTNFVISTLVTLAIALKSFQSEC